MALLAAAGASLLIALAAGLGRAGWDLPLVRPHQLLAHGPLLIGGFLGTLIGLEKAVALGRGWGYAAPILSGSGGLWLAAGLGVPGAARLFLAASAVLTAVFGGLLARRVEPAALVMLAGAVAWLAGNLLWSQGSSLPEVASWWLAFPVLTIVGERLELSRVVAPPRAAMPAFLLALAVYSAGLALFPRAFDLGLRLQGTGFLALAVWLLRHDLARRTLRLSGRHRYTALCLVSGFCWLAAAGAMAIVWGADLQGGRYEALIHAVVLGFVFGMIFGHAPIIAPMILGRQLSWSRGFYLPLVLLQASLALRLGAALAEWLPGRAWGALVNVLSVLLFVALSARAALSRPSTS